jgi:hypothetical protein
LEKAIFDEEKLIRILTRRKNRLKEGETIILNKLRRKEKLTESEFWSIFELIRQEGPEVTYSNPNGWNNIQQFRCD